MTLRDALLADTERRGVRRPRYAIRGVSERYAIRAVSEGWVMVFKDGSYLPYEVAVDDILADDWEVCA